MLQPRFTFWPWAVGAALVPALSCLGGYLAITEGSGHLAAATFLSLLLVGDALLLGVAIGDLGRTVLAMLVGGTSVGILAPWCKGPALPGCLIVMFTLLTCCFAVTATVRAILNAAFAGMAWISLGILPWWLLYSSRNSFSDELYPEITIDGSFFPWIHFAFTITNLIFIAGVFRYAFRVQGDVRAQQRL